MSSNVVKTTLDNGLTVVLKEMHHAPVISFWVWYRVGSRYERPGTTGIAHWVEHMMFKGTPQFPPGTLDRTVSREGGTWNAFTWLDFTAYYETLPSDRIDVSLRLESDRMVNTIMTPEAIESERTVILSERAMNENSPSFLLSEEVQAAAFRVHSYHHKVIGDEVDLKTMTRDDLYSFYRQYYAPNNATVVVVGDFESDDMLAKVKAHFGDIKPHEVDAAPIRVEPQQRGERHVKVKGPGENSFITVSYRSPAAADDDLYPLILLNAAFTGGGSLGFFGSSTTNKSSRLYRAMVPTGICAAAYGGVIPTVDPYLYTLNVVPLPGVEIETVQAALDAEIDRLATEPITQAELERALKRARVEFVMAGESISGQAQLIGMSESVVGDYRWFETVLERLHAVTLEDLERVRAQYLSADNRTIGWYLPQ